MRDSSTRVTAVVADDHPMYRDGVVRALTGSGQIDVVAEAEDGLAALEAIVRLAPQVDAVLAAARGESVLPPQLASGLVGEIRQRRADRGPALSEREAEVLKLMATGLSIPAIAKQLYLAPSTVKTHVQRMYEKLEVTERAAAVAEAMRRGLLE